MTAAVIVLSLAVLFCGVVLYALGKYAGGDNLDLYPPPGPPKPAPKPKNVVAFPPVQPLPPAISESLVKALERNRFSFPVQPKAPIYGIETEKPAPPPAPKRGENITFAPWVTEEEKAAIIKFWKERY